MFGVFINDTWSVGRATVNAGFRYDRYHGWLPEQEQLAGSLAEWAPRFPACLGGDGEDVPRTALLHVESSRRRASA